MGTGLRRGLSWLVHRATRWRWRPWKNALIRLFMRRYRVDLSQAAHDAPEAYPSFNDFFTRALKPEARPIAAAGLASPVDGVISAVGTAADNSLFQAKGKTYSLEDLFAGDEEQARPYRNGPFITLYLSPRDYHRVHMPADGALRAMLYAPGRLFSVNAAATRRIDKLFARNERVIATFASPLGRLAVILVGALFVSAIELAWHGPVAPPGRQQARQWRYDEGAGGPAFRRGEEIGRFNMGSTVILLAEPGKIVWDRHCEPGRWVAMGQRLATPAGL